MSSSDSASLRDPAGDSVSSSVRDPGSDLSPLRDADPLTVLQTQESLPIGKDCPFRWKCCKKRDLEFENLLRSAIVPSIRGNGIPVKKRIRIESNDEKNANTSGRHQRRTSDRGTGPVRESSGDRADSFYGIHAAHEKPCIPELWISKDPEPVSDDDSIVFQGVFSDSASETGVGGFNGGGVRDSRHSRGQTAVPEDDLCRDGVPVPDENDVGENLLSAGGPFLCAMGGSSSALREKGGIHRRDPVI